MSATPKNLYHRRLVAESAGKACWICYKPSSTVLITPDQDDYFYICAGHLKDGKFAIAKDAEDLAEKKRKEDLDKEIESVKKEYEEKMKKKLDKKQKESGDKEKAESSNAEKEAEEAEREKEKKLKELEGKKEPEKTKVDGPRIFELQKNFWQMRLQKKRDAEVARRNRERLRQPGLFPSVPSNDLK
ncbi:hypothetical protein KC343_g13668 [Hortaea werneckii]|uniref:DUF1742-domain-containing protein n=1 Tax=Hortaea werneckii TaxID=91943 RepID=A0A3M7E8G8_HORWE|nr:hypothetical protein KC352_g18250 [Hortaea werneckii]KAI7549459.1 hypothetical protein KC317_g14560 [Hortaea werneckii]KAI7599712.1 hypothetical protein KC346_g13609 [Hortaea werneckii]KAI7605654.1 hypothetical protein KC343_g13668 [Hortaea werneckii]KAI7640654.1 hypothetical protein KC319_g13876 [Hortaea werneckii]